MPTTAPTFRARASVVPGLALALAVAGIAYAVNQKVPAFSALLVAILVGVVLTNIRPLPASFAPGTAIASRRLLRIGIVLLGLQLALGDIAALGWGMIVTVVAVVAVGMVATIAMGRALGIRRPLATLIAAGFSICGAAAVAAVEGVVDDAEDEDVVTAMALVVAFGTAMIPLVPVLARAMGMSDRTAGLWAGGSIHEVAQVVAATGSIGSAALTVGVIVKLARVLMLAPVIAVLGLTARRGHGAGTDGEGRETHKRPPLVPLFVAGFLAMAIVRTTGVLPAGVLSVAKVVQTILLAAAMFALGLGVRWETLRKVGGRPVLLGLGATAVVALVAWLGVHFLGS